MTISPVLAKMPKLFSANDIRSIVYEAVRIAAADSTIREDIIANHDNNRWWPLDVKDWRLRILFAGWSTRVSYSMIKSFQNVVKKVNTIGFDRLSSMGDEEISVIVLSLGMAKTRVKYFRSVCIYVNKVEARTVSDPRSAPSDEAIQIYRREVWGAGYKVAQCAVLYVKGYQCGIFPVDSGMVSMLGPCLGLNLSNGDIAHEEMRIILEHCINDDRKRYLSLISEFEYSNHITIENKSPVWWVHLALIYYKRRFCNRRQPQQCAIRNSTMATCIGTMCAREIPQRGGVRYLIVEGPDGVGKSSVLRALATSDYEITHFTYDPSASNLAESYLTRIARLDHPELWDRSFLSEYVYGLAIRGRSRIGREGILILCKAFVDRGGAIVFLDADRDALLARLHAAGRPEEFNESNLMRIIEEYTMLGDFLIKKGLACKIDTIVNLSAESVAAEIVRKYSLWKPNSA